MRNHAPNELQVISLKRIEPSDNNVRLFADAESLESLESVYLAYKSDKTTVLPDAPVLRFQKGKRYEILSGHRRIRAAHNVRLAALPCRVVTLNDEEAYRFIRQANNFVGLTSVEKAFAVTEMKRLGFDNHAIREMFGNVSVKRYVRVGRQLDPSMFSDIPKKCDPSITLWDYALSHSAAHFKYCFTQWDAGIWDEHDCQRNFKRIGKGKAPELYQQGLRIAVDKSGTIARIRGTLDLATMSEDALATEVVGPFINELNLMLHLARTIGTFGGKQIHRFIPGDIE